MSRVTHTGLHHGNVTPDTAELNGHNMKWLKRILIALALLLTIALALPFFITLDDYIPQIEKAVSARLKEPVSIASIRFTALPLPHVTIEGITVGKSNDVKLGKVTVTPDLFSLWQPTRVIKSIAIDTLTLNQQAISKIPAWSSSDTAGPPLVRVESIQLNNAQVSFGQSGFGPFDAHVTLDSNSEPVEAAITTQDGKLKALITPDLSKHQDKSTYLLEASAKAWTLPLGQPLLFDELNIKGVATLDDITLNQLSAKLYGGTAQGKAHVSWHQGLQLAGNLDIRQLQVQQVAAMLSLKSHVSGKLDAKPVFAASLANTDKFADKFMAALRLTMPFSIQNGVLRGVDIEQAATHLSKHGTSGGETRFETLSGHLQLARRSYQFTQLKIASGSMAVDGEVNISPKKELAGRINAEVSILGAGVSVPLNVTGTVDDPTLFPTGAAMTGAAVGTALMGPGLGTAVGVKIGDWVDGLFGKQKKTKK